MKKKHSPLSYCPYCGEKWRQTDNWSAEQANVAFFAHYSDCKEINTQGINALPECLSVAQMHALERKYRGAGTPEQKWAHLYESFFPGSSAPSPRA